jgi:hypothetical protein
MPRIEMVRKKALAEGRSSPGILREEAFEGDGVLVSRSTVGGGVVSAWHHHGERHLYGFLISGRVEVAARVYVRAQRRRATEEHERRRNVEKEGGQGGRSTRRRAPTLPF